MKTCKNILFFLIFLSNSGHSKECSDYYNYSKFVNCRQCLNSYYKIYILPKHVSIGINDTLKYNVAFTGNRDYIISFCADQMYYPLNIRLFTPKTGKKIYDNVSGDYKESIKVGIINSQNLNIEISFLAGQSNKEKIIKKNVCIGMILQWRKLKVGRTSDF
jgi:hypothetical protein